MKSAICSLFFSPLQYIRPLKYVVMSLLYVKIYKNMLKNLLEHVTT